LNATSEASDKNQIEADENSAALKVAVAEYLEQEIIEERVNDYRTSAINKKYKIFLDNLGDEDFKPVSPKPHVTKIEQDGIVEITFSEPIEIVPNLTIITNGTVEVNGKISPVLELEILPGEDSDPANFNFTFKAVAQTSTKLTLQLVFDDARFVSADGDKETLLVYFRDPLIFVGVNGMSIEQEHRNITREMPA